MYRNFIPEDELETLFDYVQRLKDDTENSDFRQLDELEQVADDEIVREAEIIENLVVDLNDAIVDHNSVEAREIVRELRKTLRSVEDDALIYLEPIVGKASEILADSELIISGGTEFVARRRRDEITATLEKTYKSLDIKGITQVIQALDNDQGNSAQDFVKMFSSSETGLASRKLTTILDECLSNAYKDFLKTEVGALYSKYLQVEKQLKAHHGPGKKSDEHRLLRMELNKLKEKLFRGGEEDADFASKGRVEILLELMPDKEYQSFLAQLKKSVNPDQGMQKKRKSPQEAGLEKGPKR